MTDFKQKYSAADTVALTITLTGLSSSSTLVAGRECTAINNSTNLDLDHLLGGKFAYQSHATVGRIELWLYAPISIISDTPAYGKLTGVDAGITFDSRNQAIGHGLPLWSWLTDASVARSCYLPQISIKSIFGELPSHWGIYLINGHGGALSLTATDHAFHYKRVIKQF